MKSLRSTAGFHSLLVRDDVVAPLRNHFDDFEAFGRQVLRALRERGLLQP